MGKIFDLLLCLIIVLGCQTNSLANDSSLMDITGENWASALAQFCGKECRDGKVFYNRQCSNMTCFPCDCQKTCAMVGTCCPNYDSRTHMYSSSYGSSSDSDPSRWFGLLDCRRPMYEPTHTYLSVVGCPAAWNDSVVRDRCQSPSLDSMESVTVFSDTRTGLVFTNLFCAICNGFQIPTLPQGQSVDSNESVVYPWPLSINCKHYQNLYHMTDKFDFLQAAASKQEQCKVGFVPPSQQPWTPRSCRLSLNTSVSDRECRGPEIAQTMCARLPPVPGLAIPEYKNWHCAMCDGVTFSVKSFCYSESILTEIVHTSVYDYLPPMFVLFSPKLEFTARDSTTQVGCPPGLWRNERGNCTEATCSAGKNLDTENVTCTTALSQISGLGYSLSLVLQPLAPVFEEEMSKVGMALVEKIREGLNVSASSHFSLVLSTACSTIGGPPVVSDIYLSASIVAPRSLPRDQFEGLIERNVLENSLGVIISVGQQDSTKNLTLKMVAFGQEMMETYKLYKKQSRHMQDGEIPCAGAGQSYMIFPLPLQAATYVQYLISVHHDQFLDITPSLICPYVQFEPTTVSFIDSKTIVFTIYVHGILINVTNGTGLSLVKGKVLVCLEEFNALGKGPREDKALLMAAAIYYSEIICTCVSVLCLVAALVTYSLFPSLRSLPGLNNMCLCFSLATAQTSLVVSTVFGFKGHLSKTHCLVNGIIAHYSWLATFCWLNICCVHMCRVFTGTRGIGGFSEKKTHRRYSLYAFGFPGLIVVSTMAITCGATNGDSVGYSGRLCFLDTSISRLLVFLTVLVPFGVTMVINAVLFGLTIKEIIHVSRLQQSIKSSHGVITYVKLSTVTGLFTIVEFVAFVTLNNILLLLATPLMALQGFFIFLSFIVNKTVLNLYKELLFKRSPEEATFSSTSTKRTVLSKS